LKTNLCRASGVLAVVFLAAAGAVAAENGRSVFVLTSTNEPRGNKVVVFKLETGGTPWLSLVDMLPTGGKGGASTNAGILQFTGDSGAVANWGSNNVTELVRNDDWISVGPKVSLASGCLKPDSVALANNHLYVVGTTCAESHAWPGGSVDGTVNLSDATAAQIAAGETWAAVTLADPATPPGSVLQLGLTGNGALSGTSNDVTLPDNADLVPLGEAFWGDILGFTPAHSPNDFAILDKQGNVGTVAFPSPPGAFPNNAPCWVAKGPGNLWYTGNTPGKAVSIFFSDGQGGAYYKSVSLPGGPTDITVSADGKWLAVIYTASGEGYVAVFAIDEYGDLTAVATSDSVDVPSFSGVAFSQ
jgi:hypothetical protein